MTTTTERGIVLELLLRNNITCLSYWFSSRQRCDAIRANLVLAHSSQVKLPIHSSESLRTGTYYNTLTLLVPILRMFFIVSPLRVTELIITLYSCRRAFITWSEISIRGGKKMQSVTSVQLYKLSSFSNQYQFLVFLVIESVLLCGMIMIVRH